MPRRSVGPPVLARVNSRPRGAPFAAPRTGAPHAGPCGIHAAAGGSFPGVHARQFQTPKTLPPRQALEPQPQHLRPGQPPQAAEHHAGRPRCELSNNGGSRQPLATNRTRRRIVSPGRATPEPRKTTRQKKRDLENAKVGHQSETAIGPSVNATNARKTDASFPCTLSAQRRGKAVLCKVHPVYRYGCKVDRERQPLRAASSGLHRHHEKSPAAHHQRPCSLCRSRVSTLHPAQCERTKGTAHR